MGLVGTGGLASRVLAQETPGTGPADEAPILEGTVGLVRGQGARLSIVHHQHGSEIPPTPCVIVADIFGPDGRLLAHDQFSSLRPFETRFVDLLHPSRSGKPADSRIEIFAIVRFTPGHLVGGTLQIVDESTGMTAFAIKPVGIEDPSLGGQKGGSPTTSRSFTCGTIGGVRGQVLRVSLVNNPNDGDGKLPAVCSVVAEIRNIKGGVVTARKFQFSKSRETAFFDVPHPGGSGPTRGTRIEASVHVLHTPGHELGVSAQVLDSNTGITQFIPPTPCIEPDSSL